VKASHTALNLVVNCAARKRNINLTTLSLGNLRVSSPTDLPIRWTSLLVEQKESTTSALDLYCGDYWLAVRKAVDLHPAAISLFIASAGYGFISSEEKVFPYSATFSRGLADSIPSRMEPAEVNRKWWNHLCKWRRSLDREPSSVSDLALYNPKKPILVALSREYFDALSDDLISARNALSDPDLLMILSAGVKNPGVFAENLLPIDARMENTLGGSRGALNARMVQHLMGVFEPKEMRVSVLRPYLQKMLSEQPSIRSFDRSRMSDSDVEAFILESLNQSPSASFSALLRSLRDIGQACEYKRFRGIFQSITKNNLQTAPTI